MFGLLGWLHGLLFRVVLWLLKLPFQALLAFAVAVLALLGEEVRRWLGVLMAGLMILGVSWGLLKVAGDQQLVLLLAMLLGLLWLRAVFVAAHMTMRNRLIAVRQRQAFRELRGEVGQIGRRLDSRRGEVVEGVARRARGTVAEGVFQSNRAKRAEEQEAAEAAAERAERERAAAAEWDQAVAAKRAERERFAAEAAQRWTNRQQEGA